MSELLVGVGASLLVVYVMGLVGCMWLRVLISRIEREELEMAWDEMADEYLEELRGRFDDQ